MFIHFDDMTPRPPLSLGLQISDHFTIWYFCLLILSRPKKSGEELGDLLMEGFVKTIESHEIHQEANEGGIHQNHLRGLGQPSPLPRLHPWLEFGDYWAEDLLQETRVTNGHA